MHAAELFVGLLVALVLVALVARRVERVPEPVALVVGGIAAGLLPFAPEIRLDPEVIFVVFLPPILYPAAFLFAAEDVRSNLRPIGFLAFGLVLATMAAIAAAAHLVADIPWPAGFALGAVLAPTDPVAATAVIRSRGAPDRLATILEGESLVNDGVALTALRIAIASAGGAVGLGSAFGEFLLVAAGGALVGAALGWLTAHLRRRVDDLQLESAIAILLAYGAFLLAERLDVSGVLATVVAGYVMGRSDDIASPGTRMGGESFWSVARFLSESILFLLVGLAFAQVLEDPATRSIGSLAAITAAVVVTAAAVRVGWMFAALSVVRGLARRGREVDTVADPRERIVLGLGGLRGALSVAAALSIPAVVDGTPFPDRSTVIAVAIAAIVVLLVLPALTLGPIIERLGVGGKDGAAERERRVRARLAEVALEGADALAHERDAPPEVVARVRERYELRLQRNRADGNGPDGEARTRLYRDLYRAALDAQREELARLRREGELHGELLRELERDLDVEAVRLR